MPTRDPDERAENEAYERLAALDLLRGRTLAHVAVTLLHRGDTVAVTAAGARLRGQVVHAARDLLCLRSRGGDVDVHLSAVASVCVLDASSGVDPGAEGPGSGGVGSRPPGTPLGGGPPSFKARLYEHEAVNARLELGVAGHDAPLTGRLVAVAVDHAVVDDADGQRWLLPLGRVGWARPAPGDPLRPEALAPEV